MVKNKASGLDGFSIGFFQACWDVTKEDLMKVLQELFSFENFEKSHNVTFTTLLPKKSRASDMRDFRPISLVMGCINNLQGTTCKLPWGGLGKRSLQNPQNAFVHSRQIWI